MEDVLINFVGRVDDLQPAEDALTSIIQKEGKIGDEWKKTQAKFNEENKKSTESTNKLAKAIDDMSKAAKSMDKAAIGGTYKAYLKEIQAQLGLNNKEVVKYIQNARKAAQEALINAQSQQEIDELKLSIEVMNEELELMGQQSEETAGKMKSLRTQIKENKQELVAMAEAGLAGTPAFDDLRKKTAELQDQMGDLNAEISNLASDTKNIDGLISLAGGVAGGFAVAQGAAALFGDESEDIQKALLKVNAAMSILQGLQQVQNVLQAESSAMLMIQNVRTNALAISQRFLAATTLQSAAATTTLRTALIASGIGAFVVVLGLAIEAMDMLGDETQDTAEKLKQLKEDAEAAFQAIEELAKVSQGAVDRTVQIEQNNRLIGILSAQGGAIGKINELRKQNLALENQQLSLTLQNIENRRRQANDQSLFLKEELDTKQKIYQNGTQMLLLDIETGRVQAENSRKSLTAAADAEVARRKLAILNKEVDSIASIKRVTDAEINAIRQRAAEELSNTQLTQGERQKIIAERDLAIKEKRIAAANDLRKIELDGIEARVIEAKRGSDQEYKARLDKIEKEREIAINQGQVTADNLKKINAQYRRDIEALDLEFSQRKIENEISFLNAYVEEFGITEERRLELTVRRLERQRDLEISQAEQNAAKIAEINAKYDAQIIEAKKNSIQKQLAETLRAFDASAAQAIASNQRIVQSDGFTAKERLKANNDLYNSTIDRIAKEEDAVMKQKRDLLITEEQWDVQMKELANKRSEADIQREQNKTAILVQEYRRRISALGVSFGMMQSSIRETLGDGLFSTAITELENFSMTALSVMAQIKEGSMSTAEGIQQMAVVAFQSIQNVLNQSYAQQRAQRQQDLEETLSALEEQKNRELSAKNLTEQNKRDIEERYKQRERAEKLKAFFSDKEAKKQQAVINGLLAVSQTFATFGWPAGIIPAGVMAGIAALQVAQINKMNPPKFRRGEVNIQGPGTTTSDSIHAMISKGESVINADATSKWEDVLRAINEDRFEDYILKNTTPFVQPVIPDWVTSTTMPRIDYQKMGKAVGEAIADVLPEPVEVHNTIDGGGLYTFVRKGNITYTIKNKRYTI